jgi:signal transduction histidine kinase
LGEAKPEEREQAMPQAERAANQGGLEGKRVEAVVETLANLRNPGESLAEVAHDVRNMVTALGLYCDLLEEPGVLTPAYRHYGSELRLVATASRRLVEKLVALDSRHSPAFGAGVVASAARSQNVQRWEMAPAAPVQNLAIEILANRNLLAALAGPAIALTVDTLGGAQPVSLTGEDLTRVLVNLVKNAAEAMPAGGAIQLSLLESETSLLLTVEDTGPGISPSALDKIFESGFSTHRQGVGQNGSWPASHRGLGLSITRSIVEAAGGKISVANRPESGARFAIELPTGRL